MQRHAAQDVLAGVITGVSVSHRTASVETIELAAVEDTQAELASLLNHESVSEAFVLQTCNRVERYVVTERQDVGRAVLEDRLPDLPAEAPRWLSHDPSLEHLLRVGTGLESMITGEDQILGQLRRACEDASRADALGDLLEDAVWKAIHVGERARTETAINDGTVSLGRGAVDLAKANTDLAGATGMIIGAGRMARKAAGALADTPVDQLLIANRTVPHAKHLGEGIEVPATAISLDELPQAMTNVDVVVSATGSHETVLEKPAFDAVEDLVAVDMAQPRDIDPATSEHPGVTLLDLDDIERVTDSTTRARERAAERVETLIENELAELHRQFKRNQADDVLAVMYEGAEAIKRRELADARAELAKHRDLSEAEEDILESFADALVGQVMAAPTKSLREAAEDDDWETIQTALHLFDPGFPSGDLSMPEQVDEIQEAEDAS